jgi:hypothetical protein
MSHLKDRINIIDSIPEGPIPLHELRRLKKEEKIRIN